MFEFLSTEESSGDKELMNVLDKMGHKISLSEIEDGKLSSLIKLGLTHIVMCDGGKVMSLRAVAELTGSEVPSLMLEGGMFYLDQAIAKGFGEKILRELLKLDYIILIMNEKNARTPTQEHEGYSRTMDRMHNLKIIEDRNNAAKFIRSIQPT